MIRAGLFGRFLLSLCTAALLILLVSIQVNGVELSDKEKSRILDDSGSQVTVDQSNGAIRSTRELKKNFECKFETDGVDTYKNIYIFWPFVQNNINSENDTKMVESALYTLFESNKVSKNAAVTIVFDLSAFDDIAKVVNSYENVTKHGPPHLTSHAVDVCKSLKSDSSKYDSFLSFVKNGVASAKLTDSHEHPYNSITSPKKNKLLDVSNLMINFLSVHAWAKTKYRPNSVMPIYNSLFRNIKSQRRHYTELTVFKHNPTEDALFIIVYNDEELRRYAVDLAGVEYADIGYGYDLSGDRTMNPGKFISEYGASNKLNHGHNLYGKVHPLWCPPVMYSKKIQSASAYDPSYSLENVESHFESAFGSNYINSVCYDHRAMYLKDLGPINSVSGEYSPLFHFINGHNEKRNLLDAMAHLTKNKCYLSGYSNTILANLILDFGPKKVIQLHYSESINNTENIGLKIASHQALVAISGCPTLYECRSIAPGSRKSIDFAHLSEYIENQMCGYDTANGYAYPYSQCLSLSTIYNGLLDAYYPLNNNNESLAPDSVVYRSPDHAAVFRTTRNSEIPAETGFDKDVYRHIDRYLSELIRGRKNNKTLSYVRSPEYASALDPVKTCLLNRGKNLDLSV